MSSRLLTIGDHYCHAHDEGHRSGIFHTFDALSLGSRPRKIHVFLPREYEGSDRRYPVVYMLDGNTAFWRGGEGNKSWDVAGTLDRLNGQVQQPIVVAVHPLDRAREYTHADWLHGQRPFGGLPEHARYLATRMKPFIDRHYRTRPEPAANAIVGSSHGGLAAFWTATAHPDAFGNAGALSPSLWVGLDSLILPVVMGDLAESELLSQAGPTLADPERRPRLWIDWGMKRSGGFHNEVIEAKAELWGRRMAALLEEAYGYRAQRFSGDEQPDPNFDLWVYEDRPGGHDELAWAWRFGLLMQALFPASPAPPSQPA